MRLSELRKQVGRKPSVPAALLDRELSLVLRTARANVYDTPTHNPRITKAYSVSFPVWAVLSQRSNISMSGHTTQMDKINVTIRCDALDRTSGL